jgi:hypothetical protein
MKTLLAILSVFIFLMGCKPAMMTFKPDDLDLNYVKSLIVKAKGVKKDFSTDTKMNNTVGPEDTAFSTMKIFEAVLVDDYVKRDGIAEETIINTESKHQTPSLAMISNSYQFYIITADTSRPGSACIFIPTIFNANDSCIGLGPALIGTWAAGQIKYFKTLKYYSKKKGSKTGWVYEKKENEYHKSKSIYDPLNDARTKVEIKFEADEKKNIAKLPFLRIINIFNTAENRFGGHKPLVFQISQVFEDPDALLFHVFKTF